jgi:hypothetical protein
MTYQEDEQCAEFRKRWRTRPVYEGQVEFLGDAGGFGSSPQRVRLLPSGCIGYAKRAVTAAQMPEGAHEYIAAELAYLIGVSVPPVSFWSDRFGQHFSLSIRAFPEAVQWDEIKISNVDREALRSVFSASAVFHAWIADNDHAGHPDNLVVNAASLMWQAGDETATLPQEYYIEPDEILRESVLETIRRIDGVSERD